MGYYPFVGLYLRAVWISYTIFFSVLILCILGSNVPPNRNPLGTLSQDIFKDFLMGWPFGKKGPFHVRDQTKPPLLRHLLRILSILSGGQG